MINIADLIKPAASNSPYLKLCIYGEPSCGKTTLAAGAPKPLLVDTERGATALVKNEQLRHTPVIQRSSLQEMIELFDFLKGPGGDAYETIIIDTLSELQKMFLDNIIKDSSHRLDAYTPPDKGYEQRNQQARRFLSDIIDLPKHIILLAHVGVTKINAIDSKAPLMSPAIVQSVMGLMDVVGYMTVNNVPAPTATNPTAVNKVRVIQTLCTSTVQAKNRLSVPDLIENPTIQMFIDSHRENAGQPSVETPAIPNLFKPATNTGINI